MSTPSYLEVTLVAKGRFGPAQILDGEGLKLEISHFPGLLVDFSRVFPPKPKVVREAPRGYFSGQDPDQDQNQTTHETGWKGGFGCRRGRIPRFDIQRDITKVLRSFGLALPLIGSPEALKKE